MQQSLQLPIYAKEMEHKPNNVCFNTIYDSDSSIADWTRVRWLGAGVPDRSFNTGSVVPARWSSAVKNGTSNLRAALHSKNGSFFISTGTHSRGAPVLTD